MNKERENPNKTTLGSRQRLTDAKGDRPPRPARDSGDSKANILRLAAESGSGSSGSVFRAEAKFRFPEGYFDVPVTPENLLACRCLPPSDLEGFVEPLTQWEIVPKDEDMLPSLSKDVVEDFEVV